MRKIAITGIRKAAESVGNYVARKSLRPIARANRVADKATAAVIRGAQKVGGAIRNAERNISGAYGKSTRDASAAVIKATRSARPRARETMGQINRRKGIVNPVYTPKTQVDQHVKDHNMHVAKQLFKEHGFGKVLNKPKSLRADGDYMTNKRPLRGNTVKNMREYGANADDQVYRGIKQPTFSKSDLSYENVKPMGRSGPRYTDKQVRAGRRVLGGATAIAAADRGYNYYQQQKRNSR